MKQLHACRKHTVFHRTDTVLTPLNSTNGQLPPTSFGLTDRRSLRIGIRANTDRRSLQNHDFIVFI